MLLHDAQYVTSEWPQRSSFGHSTVDYAVGLAEAAGVARLMLFHHEPARTDQEIDDLTRRAQSGSGVTVVAAAEGDVVTVPSSDG